MNDTTLWYKQPAARFKEALPLGNGRLGAMVYGGIDVEKIQLNEDSIYHGGPMNRRNPDCLPNLKKLRRLILDGRLRQAERLAVAAMSGMPEGQRPYLPFGTMHLNFFYEKENNAALGFHMFEHTVNQTPAENYRRSLDLKRAIVQISYQIGNTAYLREAFCSDPDQVLAIRLTAEPGARLCFSCTLERYHYHNKSWKETPQTIAFSGDTGADGVRYCGMARAAAKGGRVFVLGEHLIVEDAEEALLLFAGATNFYVESPAQTCRKRLDAAEKAGWDRLLKRHIRDYQSLFGRLALSIEDSCEKEQSLANVPTDQRLKQVAAGQEDPQLSILHFHYGRYLLIASSRPGSQPANLQGIWNDTYHFSLCDSKHTININTQMNYWSAEMGNLSECHEPLFDLLERMHKNGTVTAREQYGCSGFVAHHNTDLYADTDVQDRCLTSSYWLMGGAWLTLHVWCHYQYSQDLDFLKKYFYLIEDCVRFFNDFLILNEEGWYVVVPTLSPENSYLLENGDAASLCAGCAMDNQILSELYDAYLQGDDLLASAGDKKSDTAVQKKALAIRSRICPPQIGRHGQIVEWMKDYEENEPGHRHFSPLYCVFPGELITWEENPELMNAAKTTIERRLLHGSGHTGWSRAWIINLWARLGEKEKVYENLKELLRQSTFPNLMDHHPFLGEDEAVFQIDGNLGIISGILQCFVQNDHGRVRLLPAVPEKFATGSLSGMRLKGCAEISLAWRDGALTQCTITAQKAYRAEILYQGMCRSISLQAKECFNWPEL